MERLLGRSSNEVRRTSLLSKIAELHTYLYEVLKACDFYGLVAQLVRAPPCHGGGHGFESRLGRLRCYLNAVLYGIIAQLGEHLPYKQRVIGSSPIGPIYYVLCMPMWLIS